ncbi:MAG TPA: hypothetical protein VN174_04180 [Candidatus Methanoperedens sp.]|nr:hypothetical protein [Candidatus Methanoperedens sp.]
MSEITNIKKRLSKIEKRNHRVELDKTWETSWTRRLLVLTLTYALIGLYMNIINVNRPWLNAVIPSLGFLLSTLTISWVKNLWLKNHDKSHHF